MITIVLGLGVTTRMSAEQLKAPISGRAKEGIILPNILAILPLG